MSGGHFDYNQYRIGEIATEIEEVIKNNDNEEKDEYGDPKGYFYSKETLKVFKRALRSLNDMNNVVHHIDYLICGDYSEETFHERIKEDTPNDADSFREELAQLLDKYNATLNICVNQDYTGVQDVDFSFDLETSFDNLITNKFNSDFDSDDIRKLKLKPEE